RVSPPARATPVPTRRSSDLGTAGGASSPWTHVAGLRGQGMEGGRLPVSRVPVRREDSGRITLDVQGFQAGRRQHGQRHPLTEPIDRKSTRLNSSHVSISYAV